MLVYPEKHGFLIAAQAEYDGLIKKATWTTEDKDLITARPLPLKWVFVYKFDQDGFLEKHKVRIVVRGDLQFNTSDKTDIYAHTLAIQHFGTPMAIVAVFGLEAGAMDVVGAFLNANVNGNVYCYMPQGFEEEGKVLKLKKALYGLRQSPKLWYDTLASALHELGFSPNTEEQCL
jgi:hypothetical protein